MAKMKAGRVRNAKVKGGQGIDVSDVADVVINPDGSVSVKVQQDGRITPGTDVVINLSDPDRTELKGRLDSNGGLTFPPGTVTVV
jgi:hypothetical protein